MNTDVSTTPPSLITMITAPVLSGLLGIVLIYISGVTWTFATDSILYSVVGGTGLGMVMYLILAGFTRLPLAKQFRETVARLRPLFKDMKSSHILILALSAGIGEEILFRGFLQTWLSGFDFIGIELAILIAAICFGLLHFASVGYFLVTTLIGLILGISYHLTGSLLLVMTWHFVYDVIAVWLISRRPDLIGLE